MIGDERYELVTASYVLGELDESGRATCIERAWEATSGALVVVEPGTPAGFERIREARERLIAGGACVLAPCPHSDACPIEAPDWCHFSQRVARSHVHRVVKSGALGYEDEKFAYVAAGREGGPLAGGRAIRRPRRTKGRMELDLCTVRGVERHVLRRRDGEAFRLAKKCRWGDVFEATAPPAEELAEPRRNE